MQTSRRFFSRWIIFFLVVACFTGLGCATQPPSTTDPSATSADPSSSSNTSTSGTFPGGSTTPTDGGQVTGLDGEGTGGENASNILGVNLVNAPNETLTYGEKIAAAAWDEGDKQNVTAILNSFEKVIKGPVAPAEPLAVFTHDLKGKFYEDIPQLPETGTRALLFLKKNQSGELVPVNRVQGVWPIQDGSDKTLGMGFNSSIQQVENEVGGGK
jgi:hypothetical protein